MINEISHRYLRKELVNFESLEDFDSLFIELDYSTLIMPTNDEGNFPSLDFGDISLIPLFTDMGEYEKMGDFEGFRPTVHGFKSYLHLFYSRKCSGFVINDASERFYITDAFLDIMEPFISDFKLNQPTLDEIKNIKESLNGNNSKEFLSNYNNLDLIGLIDGLIDGNFLAIVKHHPNLKGIISTDPLPFLVKNIGKDSFALIYTSDDEITHSSKEGHYSQIIKLPMMMKYVLNCDLEGIVLNDNSDNIVISRDFIKLYLGNFCCEMSEDYTHYIFEIE